MFLLQDPEQLKVVLSEAMGVLGKVAYMGFNLIASDV